MNDKDREPDILEGAAAERVKDYESQLSSKPGLIITISKVGLDAEDDASMGMLGDADALRKRILKAWIDAGHGVETFVGLRVLTLKPMN